MKKRIDCIKSSGIRRIMEQASQKKELIDLSIGQPDFKVPENVKESLKKSLDNNLTTYTPSGGLQELREKIADYHNTEDAIVTSGVTSAIFLSYSVLLEEGEELIINSPHFVVYPDLCEFLGARSVVVKTKEDFSLDIEGIKRAVTSKTKAIIINHPNNPTGKIYTKNELKELASFAKEKNLWIISDEVYSAFDYENKFTSMGELYEKTIILNGFSKSLAMTGLRIGYAAAPKKIIEDMIKLQQYTFVCAPSICQHAVNQNFYTEKLFVEEFKQRRDFLYMELKNDFQITKPEGSFYFFLKLPEGIEDEKFCEKCLERNLLVVPGNCFTEEKNYIRLSFATTTENLKKAVKILKETQRRMRGENGD